MRNWLHEDALATPQAPTLVVRLGAGQLLALRNVAFTVVAVTGEPGAQAALWRFEVVPATRPLIDPEVLEAVGLVTRALHRSKKGVRLPTTRPLWKCPCGQVTGDRPC